MNILLVDDSSTTRLIGKKTLKSLGFESVFEASDGAAALRTFTEKPIDVVFTDWNMPVMNGLELLKQIRAIDPNVPVIMVTTEGSRGKVIEAIQNGVNDYLVKPFTPQALKDKLSKWVHAKT